MSEFVSFLSPRDPNYSYLPTVLARLIISTARSGARNIGGFSERRLRSQLRRCFHRPNISPDTSAEQEADKKGPTGSTPIGDEKKTGSGRKLKRIARPLDESSEDEAQSDIDPIVSSDDDDEDDRHNVPMQPKGKGKGKKSQ